jgi:hypothetical protein
MNAGDKKLTAGDIYNRFVERARELKHYKQQL